MDTSSGSSVCTKPAGIPEVHSKGSVGAYFDRKAILCGGWMAGKECHVYDFGRQSWDKAQYSLVQERSEAAGSMMRNGSWMIIGGKDTARRDPMPTTEMLEDSMFMENMPWPEAVSGHCVEQVNSSHIFVAGGETYGGNLLDASYFLNVDSAFWNSVDDKLRHARSGHVCGFVKDHAVVAGGFGVLAVELLYLETMRWKSGPDLPFEMNWAGSMQVGRRMFVAGGEHIGYCSKPRLCFSSDAIIEIDHVNDEWVVNNRTLGLPRSKHIVMHISDELDLCQATCHDCKGNLPRLFKN